MTVNTGVFLEHFGHCTPVTASPAMKSLMMAQSVLVRHLINFSE